MLQRLPTTSLSGQLLRAVSSWVGAASWIPPWNGNGNGDPGIRMGRQRPLGWGVRGRAPGARQAALSLAPSSGWGAGLRPGKRSSQEVTQASLLQGTTGLSLPGRSVSLAHCLPLGGLSVSTSFTLAFRIWKSCLHVTCTHAPLLCCVLAGLAGVLSSFLTSPSFCVLICHQHTFSGEGIDHIFCPFKKLGCFLIEFESSL